MTNSKFPPLRARILDPGSAIARPSQELPERLGFDSPALSAMTDLRQVPAITAWINTPMEQANAKMIRHGVRLLLVLDDQDRLAGLLTANDILGEKPLRHLRRMGGTHADIRVGDIMTGLAEVETLNLAEVRAAQVGHIVASLRQARRHHALVAETTGRSVCGVFSITQIARQLGLPLRTFDIDRLFAAIAALETAPPA
ncbi:CBS domain-containing protein [Methylomagnum ishizawai]|uniref:CBS domain-containing protein n=1 Tax=Methylomagnum ishizawai TaxID=1760988 RepID=UPI001C31EB63|nr:CBS domain-containing protein [Methylomagnum ishizawai]BBL76879.1 hypothetical protein MishRS11D_39770 [Methylomagnum ishizawai]